MNNKMNDPLNGTFIPMTSIASGMGQELAPDVYSLTVQIVNVCMIGRPNERGWVLIDAGMPGSAELLIRMANERFGQANKPAAIVLTHGHFDHVGGVVDLIREWQVPVYAHQQELPYLTGLFFASEKCLKLLRKMPRPLASVELSLRYTFHRLFEPEAISRE